MSQNKKTKLQGYFSQKTLIQTEASLRETRKNGHHPLFQALEHSLTLPGISILPTEGVAPDYQTSSGQTLPKGSEPWPILVAEIKGNGVPYIKTEQIRTHAVVVPLKLNTRSPGFAGAAMAVALLQAYAKYAAATGRPPQRNLRFVFTSCNAALEAFLQRPKVLDTQAFSAIELELVSRNTTTLCIDSANFGKPSFVTAALKEHLCNLPVQQYKKTIHPLALPPFSIPFARLSGGIDLADRKVVSALGAGLLKTMELMGDTTYESGVRFMRRQIRKTRTAMNISPAKTKSTFNNLLDIQCGFEQLMHRGPWWSNPKATLLRHRKQGILIDDLHYPRYAYQLWQAKELAKLEKLLPPAKAHPPTPPKASPALLKRAKTFVPARTFIGALPLEKREVWTQAAAALAIGKKNIVEIHQTLQQDGFKPALKEVLHLFETEEKAGKFSRRPIITATQIKNALRTAGIGEGDTVMIHAGYSAYGYIECGPIDLIDLFKEAIGDSGTLCMPTHTQGLLGQLPFDAATSPAITGLVPNLFRKCPGVQRSIHPTHSVAALGPQAEYLLERSIPQEPIFGDEGFWGRLLKVNGKILMFCNSLGPNTILHGVDYWAGAALPETVGLTIRDGKPVEVLVKGMPFHGDSFAHIYKAIENKNIIYSVPLGSGTIYAMEAKKLVKAGIAVVRKNPLLATQPGCDCDYCAHLKRAEARRLKQKKGKLS